MRARGDSDASVLMWPTLFVQGIHFPTNGADLTTFGRTQYQARVGLSLSPTDLYKGVGTRDVADADCNQHEAQSKIEQLLVQLDDAGKLAAVLQEAAYLDVHQPEWEGILKKEKERLDANVVSLIDFDTVRARTVELERVSALAHSEADRLQALGLERPQSTLADLERAYLTSAIEYERRASHVRSIAPWGVKLTGGIVPTDVPVDWFGLVEVSVSLAVLEHAHAEGQYLEAREHELRRARYEVIGRLHDLETRLAGLRDEARRELAVLERRDDSLTETLHSLDGSEAAGVGHAVASLTLDRIAVEAKAAFLRGLADALTTYLVDKRA